MKKFYKLLSLIVLLAMVFFALGCSENFQIPFLQQRSISTKTTTSYDYSGLLFSEQRYEIKLVIGPNEIYRIKGKPEEIIGILPLNKGDSYKIMINNGDGIKNEITSGEIWIDGKEILSENDFKKKKKNFFLYGEIENDNPEYFIRLRGKPGTFITVNLYGFGEKYYDKNEYFTDLGNMCKLISLQLPKNTINNNVLQKEIFDYFTHYDTMNIQDLIDLLPASEKKDEIFWAYNDLKNKYYIPCFNMYKSVYNDDSNNETSLFYKYFKENDGYGYNCMGEQIELNDINVQENNLHILIPMINKTQEWNEILNIIQNNFVIAYKNNYLIIDKNDIQCVDDNGIIVCSFTGSGEPRPYTKIKIERFISCVYSETFWGGKSEMYLKCRKTGQKRDIGHINCRNCWTLAPDGSNFIYYRDLLDTIGTSIDYLFMEEDAFLTGADDYIDTIYINVNPTRGWPEYFEKMGVHNCGGIGYEESNHNN